jgi:hypothetical protein
MIAYDTVMPKTLANIVNGNGTNSSIEPIGE